MEEVLYIALRELLQLTYRVIIGAIDYSAKLLLKTFKMVTKTEGDDFNKLMITVHEKVFNITLVIFTFVTVLVLILLVLNL